MALPTFTMRQLLEAGVHFGHQAGRWNPKMEPYLYGVRNNVHIIDLRQTVPMLYRAMETIRDIVGSGGRVLFVGTKRQASDAIRTAASRSGQYYVDHRWLGGMLTNWTTMSRSIKRLQVVEEQLAGDDTTGLTKKELLRLMRERDKLDRALGGIKDMGGLPDILFVVDTNKEEIAVKEAQKLNIPIVAVLDSNSDPDGITYPIPGNDDALRAITTYCELIAGAVLDGIQQELAAAGADIGEAEELPADELAAAEQAGEDEATEPAEDAPAEEAKAEPEEEAKQPTADEAEDAPEGAEAAKDEATAEASEKAADGDQAEAKPGGDEAEATPAGGETAAEAGEETGEDKAASA